MKKTTIYLPDDLKEQIKIQATCNGRSEAQYIRDAVASCVGVLPSEPKIPLTGKGLGKNISLNIDDALDGFGE